MDAASSSRGFRDACKAAACNSATALAEDPGAQDQCWAAAHLPGWQLVPWQAAAPAAASAVVRGPKTGLCWPRASQWPQLLAALRRTRLSASILRGVR